MSAPPAKQMRASFFFRPWWPQPSTQHVPFPRLQWAQLARNTIKEGFAATIAAIKPAAIR
jgi:hypothetical protein